MKDSLDSILLLTTILMYPCSLLLSKEDHVDFRKLSRSSSRADFLPIIINSFHYCFPVPVPPVPRLPLRRGTYGAPHRPRGRYPTLLPAQGSTRNAPLRPLRGPADAREVGPSAGHAGALQLHCTLLFLSARKIDCSSNGSAVQICLLPLRSPI